MTGVEAIFKKILPRDAHYFPLLERSAVNLRTAGQELQKLHTAKTQEDIVQIASAIKAIEHNSDEITHTIFDHLNRTFVTPIDREDIHSLANALDDILDLVDAVAARLALYQFTNLTSNMLELVTLIGEATIELESMVCDLKRLSKNPDFTSRVRKTHKIEENGDMIFRRAIAALFTNGTTPLEVIKQKDILEGLEESIDYCQNLADIIEQVSIKNA